MKQWLPIETEQEYKEASRRIEEIYDVKKAHRILKKCYFWLF